MKNTTNHASSLTAREGEIPDPLTNTVLGIEERREGRGERGNRTQQDCHMCIAHFIVIVYIPRWLGREPEESVSFTSVLRALCTRVKARFSRQRPRASPHPCANPCSLRWPRVPRRKREAANLPQWHRSHKPTRNCKANKAEILGLVSVVTRSTLFAANLFVQLYLKALD